MAVAIDFETYYARDYSVTGAGIWHYVTDPRFDAYPTVSEAVPCVESWAPWFARERINTAEAIGCPHPPRP
jgi:hypothetical protein